MIQIDDHLVRFSAEDTRYPEKQKNDWLENAPWMKMSFPMEN